MLNNQQQKQLLQFLEYLLGIETGIEIDRAEQPFQFLEYLLGIETCLP